MTFDFDKKESEIVEDNAILEIRELQKEITNMSLGELMNLDNEILTEEELAELEEHELVTNCESLGASGQYLGYTWYSVELGEDSIDVYCKF